MTHQDKISLLITFMVGIVVGGYVYLSGFATTYKLPTVGTEDQYTELVITGDAFGACESNFSCLSFQLLQDGSYQAIVGNETATRSYKGTISSRARQDLATVLDLETLHAMSEAKANPVCHYGEEATNFKFLVSREGKNYSFDTCRSNIDYASKAWKSLATVWQTIAADSLK